MIKTFYSFIAVLLITALVVSCASSSNDGGDTTTETSIFSHSSYTFMPLNANISQTSDTRAFARGSTPTNGILLGSVLIKEAEINKLVAAEINKLITEEGSSKVDAKDISIDNNYTIEYTFVDDTAKDPNSILNRYLTIISNRDNRGVRIYAINPFAFNISLTDILTEIPSVTVAAEITITVSSLVNDEISISHTVTVRFPEVVDTFPNVNDAVSFNLPNNFIPGRNIPQNIMSNQRDFQPDDVIVPKTFLLNYTTPFVEEQAAATTISIGGVNNVLNRYGFTPNPGTGTQDTRTIFFTLLDAPGAPVNSCNSNKVYLDNIDTRVKSAISFNYEELYNEEDRLFKCILGASFDGKNYQALTAAISNTTTVNSKQASYCPHGEANELCYYVPLTINITNIDEAPTITAPPLSIDEGVGPTDADYPGINFTPASGVLSKNDNTMGNLAVVLGDITIADTDEVANRTSKLSVNAAETKVVSVSPAHGNGLFSIVKQEGDNNLFTLRVNASSLDYEGFQPGELNAGKAIYMVTITTKDTDGTVANVKTQQVPVEITDVIFAPVAIGNSRLKLGFTKAGNIESREDGRIVLLPGASMLANGRTTLGTVKAVNPENNSDKELFYAVFPNIGPELNLELNPPLNPELYPELYPEQTSNNFAVVDGFGDGDVQTLVLNNLGLTEVINEFTLHVQAFYRPLNFDLSNLVNISYSLFTNKGNDNFIDMDRAIAIRIAVDDTAYSNSSDSALYINRTKSLNPARSPIFRARQFTGYVTEKTSGDNVTGFAPFNPTSITIPQASNLGISPRFALVGAEGFGEFKLQDVGVNQTHSDLFSINPTTGNISLKGNNTVEFPDFHTIVVRLANASDINNAENALSHDYATVNVLVNDINSAPVISDFNDFTVPNTQIVDGIGSYNETANKLTLNVTINENTPVGTVLARFTVTDDNDDTFAGHDFNFGASTSTFTTRSFYRNAVKLTFTPAASEGKQKKSTATLTLVKSLNFEDFNSTVIDESVITITNDTITLGGEITRKDKGRYEYNPLSQPEPTSQENVEIIALIKRFLLLPPIPLTPLTESQSKPMPPEQVFSSTSLAFNLAFNLVVLDVAEKPLINTEASVTSGYIREDAPVGTAVSGILINIANINETDANALVYELGPEFDEVFNVNVTDMSDDNKRSLQLIVADADKLENLGDGLVHTSNLTITNNTGGTGPLDRSDPITIHVRVIDVQQPINPIAVDTTGLQIKETDVDGDFSGAGGDGRYVIKDNLFVLNPIDVSKDTDDFLSIGGREPAPLVTISYAITDVSLESSTPDNANDIDVTDGINSPLLPLLSLNPSDGNNNVSLAIENADYTDYIEASLFGDLSVTLGFMGNFIGGIEPPAINPVDFTVEVIKANPKNVAYNTASDTAPVYLFKYIQSKYADEVTPGNVRADAISPSAIVSGGLTTGGTRPQINLTGDIYNTALVRLGDDNADDTYFIERNSTRLNIIRAGRDNQQQVDNDGVIAIPFTSTENIASANIQILSEDASGKLVDSADNFYNFYNFYSYFDIKVNNTYNFASAGSPEDIRKALLITQKQFAVIDNNGEVNETNKYNALDTIPLFQGETEATNQTYYIRVSQGDIPSNASNYALAQVHLNIEAAGLNIPAVVRQLYIGEICCIESALTDLAAGTGNIGENSITPNAFGTHFLYINITNQDYVTEEEGETRIKISVPTGGLAPTSASNLATDDQLIALSPTSGSSDALPGANIVTYTQDGTDKDRIIRFALARNVYGNATINVHIQENDAEGFEIDSNTHTFTLNVNEDTSGDSNGNNVPTVTNIALNNGEITVTNNNNIELAEDTGLLEITDGTQSRNITIVPEVAMSNDDTRRNQTVSAALEAIFRNDSLPGSNTKKVDVFTYDATIMNNNIITYQKHGWGLTAIAYRIIETEPRGFGDTVNAVIYNEVATGSALLITVTSEEDDAVFVEATAEDYNLNEFETSPGVFNQTNNLPPKPITLTYRDPDLRFSNFSVGAVVPATVPETIMAQPYTTEPPSLAKNTLTITPDAGAVPVEVPNSELFTVTFMSDFSTILEADYDVIASQGNGAVYAVPFTGTGATDANVSIRILNSASDRIVNTDNSDGIFIINGASKDVQEGSDVVNISSIFIEDTDFARPLTEPETITFSVDSVIEQVREGSDDTPRNITSKIRWEPSSITSNGASVLRARQLTSADVGNYTVTWSTTERYSAAGGPRTHIGFFTLNVIGVDSNVTVATQLMTDVPGVTQLLAYDNNDNITILVNITSEDFIEGGQDYDMADFSLTEVGLFVVERGEYLAGGWEFKSLNTCILSDITFDKFEDITDTIADKTDKQRFLKFTIGVQELDNAATQAAPSTPGGVCANLTYDIVGTSFEGFSIQLNNQRPERTASVHYNSEGIIDRYRRVSSIDTTAPVFTPTSYSFNLPLAMANAAGVVVGNISAVEDNDDYPFDYSLTGNNNVFEDLFELAAANNTDGTRNIILRRAATFYDFPETSSSVTFQVVATHQFGGLSSEADVTVTSDTDGDGDGVINLYDAFPDDGAKRVNGSGDSSDPYIISNIYQLQAIAGVDHTGTALDSSDFTNNRFLYGTDAADQLTKHYKLANDINASATNTGFWNKLAVGSDKFVGHGWTPIAGKEGQSFGGSFNGDGYVISNLNIILRAAATTDTFGLFGTSRGNISAVGLENIEMRIQPLSKVLLIYNNRFGAEKGNGGLLGKNEQAGIIQYSYVSGFVNATGDKVGGLVGSNEGEISYSYSTAAVEGRLDSGGLVGSNTGGGRVLSSYATGNVSGESGYREEEREKGDRAVQATAFGGLIGHVNTDGRNMLNVSYAIGTYKKAKPAGGDQPPEGGSLVGHLGLTTAITSSYWYNNPDITDIKGIGNHDDNSIAGHAGLTTAQLQGCGLGATAISGVMPVPDCANLFPSSDWGDNTKDGVTRGWIFNAGKYPSLRAVRTSDSKQLFPTAAEQECQRNEMPLGCE